LLGIVRQAKAEEWKPIAFVLFFYSCVLLLWSFPQPERFLLPFVPVFFAGLWVEMRRLVPMLLTNLRADSRLSQRVVAAALACVLASLFGFMGWNYVVLDPRQLRLSSAFQAHALEERKQAYQWIREHTDPSDRVAAYEDAVMYLYTGRQGLRPAEFLPSAVYMSDEDSLQRDLNHIADATRHAKARYWLRTIDDPYLNHVYLEDAPQIERRMAEIDAVLPVVFRSRENTVAIHDASCVVEAQRPDCQVAVPILFPAERKR
jgi:hypothetical protein